jgi:cytoskeletal protein RodZ
MLTIGEYLKSRRLERKITLNFLEKETKIKKEFLQAIENNLWDKLPEFPVVSGFVKNISLILKIDPNTANAILRRDYPPKKLTVNPKPDIKTKILWSPKFSFVFGVVAFLFVVLSYLGYEYSKFVKPPILEIFEPKENQVLIEKKIRVEGKTTTDATIFVNNQQAIVDKNGNFETVIEIDKNTKELKFIATSRSGKKTEIVRRVSVDID